jgi:predicted enzyme related to lactoylglutathione lyase
MVETTADVTNRPAWIELSSADPAASREFYARLFGWDVQVSPDPQYGGYALAKLGGNDIAGIGPKQSDDTPTAWGVYIGTDDVDELAKAVQAAGGTVLAPPFDVGDQGRMAVFQDPSGAVISAWQAIAMRSFQAGRPNTFGWAELNARNLDRAIPFYESVFGWRARTSEPSPGAPDYTEFQLAGESIAGAQEMNPMVPAQVPSYWMAYFTVKDVDGAYQKAIEAGAREMLPPQDFPGGRFAILSDPLGASFGLMNAPEA